MSHHEAAVSSNIESILIENRLFPPPEEFSSVAHIKAIGHYRELYNESINDPEGFWGKVADELHWFKKWSRVREWNPPHARWFVDAQTNLSYNCLDRHLNSARRNKAALIWEGESGEVRTLTYQQLHHEVCKFANALLSLGIKTGDRVILYMGMVPELATAMLACARIGATHSVVFGGFSAEALRDRINDARASAVVTQDGSLRRGTEIPLKAYVDDAVQQCPTVRNVVVSRRTGTKIKMEAERDHWWHELMEKPGAASEPQPVDSEHPLFTLYTSGTTGKPKGIVHTTAAMTYVYLTSKYVFDLKERHLLVHGRYWMGYRPQLRALRPAAERSDQPDLRRGAESSLSRQAMGHYREASRQRFTAPTAIRAFIAGATVARSFEPAASRNSRAD